MIGRIFLSLVVAVAVTLVCILLGNILASLQVAVAVTVGQFLTQYSAVIGVLAGVWFYFSGRTSLV